MPDMLVSLTENRENLLREHVIARGVERASILAKFLEIEVEIQDEKKSSDGPAVAFHIYKLIFRNIAPAAGR